MVKNKNGNIKKVSKTSNKIDRKKKKTIPTRAFQDGEKKYNEHMLLYGIECALIIILAILLLVLLSNKTFFKNKYVNDKIDIDIPILMYFVKDDGNEVVFKTLRSIKYLKNHFEKQVSGMFEQSCGENSFYYNEEHGYAIYDIKIENRFAINTVKIRYAKGNAKCLCSISKMGLEAEELCQ